MGKSQSKRSVDITTEPSKEVGEGVGEVKKIDDADPKAQLNGDTPHTETETVSHSFIITFNFLFLHFILFFSVGN